MSKSTFTVKAATAIAGTIGFPSKMPGTSYGIPAAACKLGSILAKIKGSTCHDCYAFNGNYQYSSVKKAQAKRLAGIVHPLWVAAMVLLLTRRHNRGIGRNGRKISFGWHRWHDAGDLQSVEHLAKICQVARMLPHFHFWLPTRETGILATYKKTFGALPSNLLVRVSATKIDGNATITHPHTSTVHDKAPAIGRRCPAPDQDNACGDCRACWSFDVANVSYHLH